MALSKKKIRYGYWLTIAFIQKNIQSILLSFVLSIIGIVTVVSISPYLIKQFTTETQIIGLAGVYNVTNLPDEVQYKISNGLLHINDQGEVIPLLAESWEQLNKGKEFRFKLKKGLLWNDGNEFKAQDINYKFIGVKTEFIGNDIVIFKLQKELPIFPTFLTQPVIKQPLLGVAGQYKIDKAKIKAGEVQELRLSPIKENMPILIYKFYDTETKLINAYKLGEITQMKTNKKNVANVFAQWNNTKVEKTIDYNRITALFFNMNHPFLKAEKDIRHAIAQSISPETFKELGEEASGPIPPTSWAYNPPPKKYTYNPTAALKTLKKYQDGTQSATLTISTYYDNLALADEIKTNMESAGVPTKVEVLAANQPASYDLFLAQLELSSDPDQYFFWHSLQRQGNTANYHNVRIDKLLEDGRGTFNVQQRKKIYADFQRILVDDMPAHFLYHPYTYTIKRK